jgi:hypothetical protein
MMQYKYDKTHPVIEADREMRTVWVCDIKQHMVVQERRGTCTFEHPNKTICGRPLIAEEQPTGKFVCEACRSRRKTGNRTVSRMR